MLEMEELPVLRLLLLMVLRCPPKDALNQYARSITHTSDRWKISLCCVDANELRSMVIDVNHLIWRDERRNLIIYYSSLHLYLHPFAPVPFVKQRSKIRSQTSGYMGERSIYYTLYTRVVQDDRSLIATNYFWYD